MFFISVEYRQFATVEGNMATVTFSTYDTVWNAEGQGHAKRYSLWRWYDGFRTARVIMITGGVATPSPGLAQATVDQYDAADSGSGQDGKAIWHSTNQAQTVTSAEGTILTTAGYSVT